MSTLPWFTDAELQALCEGLEQPAAQIRYLQRRLGLKVERKPNGRPLLMRSELEHALGAGRHTPANDAANGSDKPLPGAPNRAALLQVITGGRRGAKAQGR